MAFCLTTPDHYLNQCSVIINAVLWHSLEGTFTGNSQDICPWYEFENYKLQLYLPWSSKFSNTHKENIYVHIYIYIFTHYGLMMKARDPLLPNWNIVNNYLLRPNLMIWPCHNFVQVHNSQMIKSSFFIWVKSILHHFDYDPWLLCIHSSSAVPYWLQTLPTYQLTNGTMTPVKWSVLTHHDQTPLH